MKTALIKFVFLATLGGILPSTAAEGRKPNVLLIVADDLGYGELGSQGFTKDIPTPNIDSISANGVRFTNGYVSGPYCSPTRAGLLTGRYQQRFGHEFNPGPAVREDAEIGLPLEEKTIADRLKPAGYATGWFGKSHLGSKPAYHPQKRGFDEFYGFLGGAHSYVNTGGGAGNAILRGTEPVADISYTTEAFGAEATSFIERHRQDPWLVYLAYNAVHAPLETLEKYESRFTSIADPKRRKFAALLSALDDSVGSVLTKVRELKLEEDTLIFFISDNGGPTASITSGNGPLRGFKSQVWEGGVRVPFAVQWKGHLPAGKVEDRPVIQLDILPTVLSAAGAETRPEWKLDGVNLLPYLSGENATVPHEALFWRFGPQAAVRSGDWKLVKAPGGSPATGEAGGAPGIEGAELYNLSSDIGEKNNLAASEPAKVKELAARWDNWNRELAAPRWTQGNPRAGREKGKGAPEPSKGSAQGPWSKGDSLTVADSPQIAGRALTVSAEIEPSGSDGVILAQGGAGQGFAFFLSQGKLTFAVRAAKELSTASAPEKLPSGKHTVGAVLAADGAVTFLVDGNKVGEGKLSGPVAKQPGEGLTVGEDGRSAVGAYTAPHAFPGTLEKVTLTLP